ncbi:MAG TPA: hypothetical protein VMM59_11480 [Thermohalobaculum sp.]|nr:hypothetical protein [Thermohalobaculum sp.]
MGEVHLRFRLDAGFPADSRFLDGHFPANPVVPGSVLIGFLAARLAEADLAVARIDRMKFRRILRPGMPFELRVDGRPDGAAAEFRDAEGVFAAGRLVLRPRDD